ncbi:MAG TPA: S41 family peptidase [Gemmatimonadaceae bacterium]|jgi:carboxyl-terminal processing protease|nr:S41 family peptidase [Gemmatimonadaceae bacterium]
MPRLRTAAAATLLVVPIVAGGFLLEAPRARANAKLFEQVLSLVSTQYVDTIPVGSVYEKAAEGLVRELNDPYSELLTPKESDDFNRNTGGRYGGTGMLLGEQAPGVIVVDRVFPNTPAEDGGVREGDHVLAVDSVSTATIPFAKVSDLLRGDPGSPVTVTYGRPGVPAPIKLKFTRRVIRVPAVAFSGNLGAGNHVGYIPLQTFNENTADEVEAAVDSLVKAGATSLVLDMRDNGGGIVDQALATASLFLRDGQDIVSVRSRNQPTSVDRSHGKHLALSIPLVVLVDGGSASATEIVAGALQDHDRALVIGTTSFGKGLVQSVYQLDDGYYLKMTTGKWYTPSGRSIHRDRKLLPNGDLVEVHPDSLGKDSLPKVAYKSDAGRIVYGGGGIRPDIVVSEDTLSTLERSFLVSIATKRQAINTILADYALELKGSVSRNFTVPPAWTAELMRRINASSADIKIEPSLESTAETFLTHDLENRVARLAFGDAAAKARDLADDKPLTKALDLLQHSSTQAQLLAAGTPRR